jgi:ribosomal protein L40E
MTAAPSSVRTWLLCRNCGATIGEVVGCRIIVVVRGINVNFPVVPGTIFTCRKCGHPNVIDS